MATVKLPGSLTRNSDALVREVLIEHNAVFHGNQALKQIALTFDDGPHPGFTPQILAILQQYNVKASFFLVGMKAMQAPDLVRAIFDAGHGIGNHTFHHPRLPTISPQEMAQELRLCGEALQAITGEYPHYFRPPGGRVDAEVLKVAESRGYSTIMWSISPADIKHTSPERILQIVTKQAHNGAIILLHDGVPETIAVLPQLIIALKAKGYQFVTIDTLLQENTVLKR